MPTQAQSGVFVTEQDRSAIISNIYQGTVVGLVGESTEGPLEPIRVNNYDEFESLYGKPNPSRPKLHDAAYTILNAAPGGGSVVVNRAASGGSYGGLTLNAIGAEDNIEDSDFMTRAVEFGETVTADATNTVMPISATDNTPNISFDTLAGSTNGSRDVAAFFYAPGTGEYSKNYAVSIDSVNLPAPALTKSETELIDASLEIDSTDVTDTGLNIPAGEPDSDVLELFSLAGASTPIPGGTTPDATFTLGQLRALNNVTVGALRSTLDGDNSIDGQNGLRVAKDSNDNILVSFNLAPNPSVYIRAQLTSAAELVTSAEMGSALPVGTHKYKIVPINSYGEGVASEELRLATASSANEKVTVSGWTKVSGASRYNIYRQDDGAGMGGTNKFLRIGSTTETTFDDIYATPTGDDAIEIGNGKITDEFTVNIFDDRISKTTPIRSRTCTLVNITDGAGTRTEIEEVINRDLMVSKIKVKNNYKNVPQVNLPIIFSQEKKNLAAGTNPPSMTPMNLTNALKPYEDKKFVEVSLMCQAGIGGIDFAKALYNTVKTRGNGVAVLDVDMDEGTTRTTMISHKDEIGIDSSRVVFAGNRIKTNIPNSPTEYLPASVGAAHAIIVNENRDPSESPAGSVKGVFPRGTDTEIDLKDADKNLLKRAKINYFEAEGGLVYLAEAVTSQTSNSQLKWIAARRMLDRAKRLTSVMLRDFLQSKNTSTVRTEMNASLNVLLGGLVTSQYVVAARGTVLETTEEDLINGTVDVDVQIQMVAPIDQIYATFHVVNNVVQ